MASGSAEDNLRRVFRAFDINSDGGISRKELEKVVKHLHDGSTTTVQWREDDVARRAFDEMDTDGDGKVDQEEFVSACLAGRRTSAALALKVVGIFVADG